MTRPAPEGVGERQVGDDERVSLHGPPFEDVLAALIRVDPRDASDDKEADT